MKLKSSVQKNYFIEKLKGLAQKRTILFTLLGYNLFLAILAAGIFFIVLPDAYRAIILKKLPPLSTPKNYIASIKAQPEELVVDIKHKHYQKLAYIRSNSFVKGSLYDTAENSVPAEMTYNGEVYKVNLSLKGRLMDHWRDEDMWSLKVKVKNGKTIMGMKNFAIQHPRTRNYLNEWVFHELLEYAGVNHLRYDFIKVNINGRGARIYALEEKFEKRLLENQQLKEGPIFKFNRDYYWDGAPVGTSKDFWASDLAPFQASKLSTDTVRLKLFNKAKTLVEAFRQEKLETSQVFDIQKLAMFFAIIDLAGHHHASSLDNLRFYYNPITSLIEPIPYDNEVFSSLREQGLLGVGKQLGKHIQHRPRVRWKNTPWYEAVFKDVNFYSTYIKALKEVSEQTFLDGFFESTNDDFQHKMNILHIDHPGYTFDFRPILLENQHYIKRAVTPQKLIQAYVKNTDKSKNILYMDICNIYNMPVEVIDVNIGDSIKLKPLDKELLLQPNVNLTPVQSRTMAFEMPKAFVLNDSLMGLLQVNCALWGSDEKVQENTFPWPLINEKYLIDDLPRKKPNIKDFDFLVVDEETKQIQFKIGTFKIEKDLIFPEGYKVLINEGTSLDLSNKANIFSHSPISFIGSNDLPILIHSSDSTSQGIVVMNVSERSDLQYVHFDNLSNPEKSGWSLTASVTFYKSPVHIDYCLFKNNRSGDDYLNIIHSDYEINHAYFKNVFADAFDGDFTNGQIKNTQFRQIGNDAIDISGSKLFIENILIDQVQDKGLSAGENSHIKAKQVKITSSEIAVTSKDLSTVFIDGIDIQKSRIAYTAFQKKQEFGPASINVLNPMSEMKDIELEYLIEEGSKVTVNNKEIKFADQMDNVKEILYGIKYGKSSK